MNVSLPFANCISITTPGEMFFIQNSRSCKDTYHKDDKRTSTGEIPSKILSNSYFSAFSKAFRSYEIQQDTEKDIRESITICVLFSVSFPSVKSASKTQRNITLKDIVIKMIAVLSLFAICITITTAAKISLSIFYTR